MKRKVVLLLVTLLATNFAMAQLTKVGEAAFKGAKNSAKGVSTVVNKGAVENAVRGAATSEDQMVIQDLFVMMKEDRYLREILINQAFKTKSMNMLHALLNDPITSDLAWSDASRKDKDFLQKIIQGGSFPTRAALWYPSVHGKQDVVNLFAREGKLSASLKYEMLYNALRYDHFAVASDLLEKFHVDINPEAKTFVRYGKDGGCGNSDDILYSLGSYGSISKKGKALRFALENGANPNLVYKDTGNSIYFQLLLDGKFGGLKMFREYGAKLEGDMLAKANLLLHEKINDEGFTRALIDAGADPHFKLDGITPQERAVLASYREQSPKEKEQIDGVVKFYEDLSNGKVEPYYNKKGEPLYWEEREPEPWER